MGFGVGSKVSCDELGFDCDFGCATLSVVMCVVVMIH